MYRLITYLKGYKMAYTKETKSFVSPDKETEIAYYVYTPDQTPKGIFHILHGLFEYTERYEHFASVLCDNGFVVCGADMRGHGKSVKTKEGLGYFGDKNGCEYFSRDVEELRLIMRKKYRRLPYIMFGHGMGSLVLRDYMIDHGRDIDGAIISGTVGNGYSVKKDIILTELKAKFGGGKAHKESFKKKLFKGFDTAFNEKKPNAWLSSDSDIGIALQNDELCNFELTAYGYTDLLRLYQSVSSPDWVNEIPQSLPVFLMSGKNDPVGGNGQDIDELYKSMQDAEIKNLSIKLYKGARHNLVNETNKDEVFADVNTWGDIIIEGVVECNKLN